MCQKRPGQSATKLLATKQICEVSEQLRFKLELGHYRSVPLMAERIMNRQNNEPAQSRPTVNKGNNRFAQSSKLQILPTEPTVEILSATLLWHLKIGPSRENHYFSLKPDINPGNNEWQLQSMRHQWLPHEKRHAQQRDVTISARLTSPSIELPPTKNGSQNASHKLMVWLFQSKPVTNITAHMKRKQKQRLIQWVNSSHSLLFETAHSRSWNKATHNSFGHRTSNIKFKAF